MLANSWKLQIAIFLIKPSSQECPLINQKLHSKSASNKVNKAIKQKSKAATFYGKGWSPYFASNIKRI